MTILESLHVKALQIKNEIAQKANSALRIGGLFDDIVSYLSNLGSMAKVNDVIEENKKFARTSEGWEEITSTEGESLMELDGDTKVKPKNDKTIDATKITGLPDISGKVDKVEGKGLSTEDFTNAMKNKLANQSGTNSGDQNLSVMYKAIKISLRNR